ncbi:Peptidoglycan/LPS O-acetylase OafA/YrhL, contains acyltransferase and SGNH-hydrolase domains [Nonomuraea solani]|uniref:Peptidoglycan/LPS O-acetylase OafA/YrhL, contains acyltransferase and SGNH-hydrolase domains n=1 Tax=Nonomuraea solani TaxID=1144553 RepID=A0A1H6ELP8_9ACTN|nr:acyltransferase [Nonomuraea solani]SEG97815.1 Peptidoglycan/LPS O-acetylase OafA/YrhL, contains acyltransferase and SGNH-hydrolase domains [Nonomuraea solani]
MSINLAARESGGGLRTELRTHAPPPARRQTWLDALRGVAVLAVLFEHLLDPLFPEVRTTVSPWFDFGQFGVMVFFLVSGYVVPASLERRGSVSGFWISRVFRIYPLWILVAAIGTVFGLLQVYSTLPAQLGDRPAMSALAHLTMLQDFLQTVSVVNVFWTLSYEMLFYLLVTALFVAGRHRASTGTLTLATAGILVGGLLPAGALSQAFGGDTVVVIAAVVMITGLAAILTGGHRVRLYGAAALALLAVVLLSANSRIGAWQSLAIIATMFAGTALYRLDQGQVSRRATSWAIGLVPVASITAAIWFGPGWGMPDDQALAFRWSWSTAVALAWLTFLIARRTRPTGFLVHLGLISYSVYLLHPLAIQVLRRLTPDPTQIQLPERLAWSLALLAVVIACANLSYRYIEKPAQRLGRRLRPSMTRLIARARN